MTGLYLIVGGIALGLVIAVLIIRLVQRRLGRDW